MPPRQEDALSISRPDQTDGLVAIAASLSDLSGYSSRPKRRFDGIRISAAEASISIEDLSTCQGDGVSFLLEACMNRSSNLFVNGPMQCLEDRPYYRGCKLGLQAVEVGIFKVEKASRYSEIC